MCWWQLRRGSSSNTTYRFTHDRIQEVSQTLLDGQELNAIRVRMGKELIQRATSPVGEDWMLFVGVDHLNASSDYSSPDNVTPSELAQLNLLVAEKAIQFAAFVPASMYLRRGRAALSKTEHATVWKDHYDLALNLHRESADVEIFIGNFDEGHNLSQEVLKNARSLPEKLPTYLSLAKSLGRRERHVESLELCQAALGMLGVYPRQFVLLQVIRDFRSVRKAFRKLSDFDVLLLPRMTDETKLIIMELWNQIGFQGYYCGKKLFMLIGILRQLQMTFKYGLCGRGAAAIVGYGFLMMALFDDADAGRRMANLAKMAIGSIDDTQCESIILFTTVSWFFLIYLDCYLKLQYISPNPFFCSVLVLKAGASHYKKHL